MNEWDVHGDATLHTLERRFQDILKGIETHEVPDDDDNDDNNDEKAISEVQSPSQSRSQSPSPSPVLNHNLIRAVPGRKSNRVGNISTNTSATTTIKSSKNLTERNMVPVPAPVPVSSPPMRFLSDDFTVIPLDSIPHYRCVSTVSE